jgi:hypothetical protein
MCFGSSKGPNSEQGAVPARAAVKVPAQEKAINGTGKLPANLSISTEEPKAVSESSRAPDTETAAAEPSQVEAAKETERVVTEKEPTTGKTTATLPETKENLESGTISPKVVKGEEDTTQTAAIENPPTEATTVETDPVKPAEPKNEPTPVDTVKTTTENATSKPATNAAVGASEGTLKETPASSAIPGSSSEPARSGTSKRKSLARIFSKRVAPSNFTTHPQVETTAVANPPGPASPNPITSPTSVGPVNENESNLDSPLDVKVEGRQWKQDADNDSLYCY